MVKKKFIKRDNRPINMFLDGGPVRNITYGLGTDLSKITNLGSGGASGTVGMLPMTKTPSGLGIGNIAGLGSTALGMFNTAMSNALIADTSELEALIKAQKNMVVGASSNDALMSEWGAWNKSKDDYTASDVRGKDTGELVGSTLGSAASGAASGASVGGPIGGIIGGVVGLGSSIAGWLTGDSKARRKARLLNQLAREANERALSSFETRAENIDTLSDLNLMANYAAYGGSINIKPENRGKFTEYCGGKVTQECINKGKSSPSPTIRKRAVFAENARGWKHADGGNLNTHGGDFTNGVISIGNGGTHENNPFEGVLIGMDSQGTPNLVEEGEVIYNDYVFSNRMNIPDDVRKKYKLGGKTFAKAAKSAQMESKERPNDPISKRGLDSILMKLSQNQEIMRQLELTNESKMYAHGGKMGMLYDGLGNNPNFLNDMGYGYQDYGTLETPITSLLLEKMYNNKVNKTPLMSIPTPTKTKSRQPNLLRYAPVIGSGLASIADIFSSPDYSGPDSIVDSVSGLSNINFTPIGNYLTYNPLDRDYYINKLNAQSGATRRALMNTSGGNRLLAQAGILASDYNYGQQLGDLARKAEEYNQSQKERVESFNRQTNMFNSEAAMKAAIANKQNEELRFRGMTTAAQMRQAIKEQEAARRSNNINKFLQGISNIGQEEELKNWLDILAASGLLKMNTKGQYTGNSKSKGGKLNRKRGTYA